MKSAALFMTILALGCGPKHNATSGSISDACAAAARNAYVAGEGRGEPGSRDYTLSLAR